MSDLTRLSAIVAKLPEGEEGFLSETRHPRESVDEITRLQARLATSPIDPSCASYAEIALHEDREFPVPGRWVPWAAQLRGPARRRPTGCGSPKRQLLEIRPVLEREPTPQVFRAGDPVDREREAFVPTASASSTELEQQVMLSDPRLPGNRALRPSSHGEVHGPAQPVRVPAAQHPARSSSRCRRPEAFTSLGSLVGD